MTESNRWSGTGGKTGRVIPHKVYAALAMGRPVITADTPAARELLSDGDNAILCPPGDPVALASCIDRLAGDRELASAVGARGRQLFECCLGISVVSESFRRIAEGFQHGRTGRMREG